MKATGIVRRIDDLGRVVIPKEIRKTLRLSSGDPLEIFTECDELLLKKYSPIKSLDGFAKRFAECLASAGGCAAAVCDTDSVIACSGGGREMAGKRISKDLERVMRNGRVLVVNVLEGGTAVSLTNEEEKPCLSQVIAPVSVDGDCIGACILFSFDEQSRMRETDVKIAKLGAELLARSFCE